MKIFTQKRILAGKRWPNCMVLIFIEKRWYFLGIPYWFSVIDAELSNDTANADITKRYVKWERSLETNV